MRALFAVLVSGALACEPLPPRSLDEVVFEPGARLDTHREVGFEVRDPQDAILSVRLEDGRSLYGGPAAPLADRPARLRVPAGTAGFWVDVRATDGAEERVWVPLADDVAVLRLGGPR